MATESDRHQQDHRSPADATPNVVAPSDPASLAWRIATLRRYDLNLLLSLHALLHTRNVTLAGDWLGVTQPAMSTDLRRLRQMFGD
jgi:Bacterial regulatory helix-turn-helix protein, lysR family